MRTLEDLEQAFDVGLHAWEQQIVIRYANRMALRIIREIKRKTPVDTGNLRRRWFHRVEAGRHDAVIRLANDAEYAAPVNHGHRIVRDGKTVGYKDGEHMLEKGIGTYQDNYMETDVREMLEALRKGMGG